MRRLFHVAAATRVALSTCWMPGPLGLFPLKKTSNCNFGFPSFNHLPYLRCRSFPTGFFSLSVSDMGPNGDNIGSLAKARSWFASIRARAIISAYDSTDSPSSPCERLCKSGLERWSPDCLPPELIGDVCERPKSFWLKKINKQSYFLG